MKSRSISLLLFFLCMACLVPGMVLADEMIDIRDYWILQDGYQAEFSNGKTLEIKYGKQRPYIDEDVFEVKWPWSTNAIAHFFNHAEGPLKLYGAYFYDSAYQENWAYIPVETPVFLPAQVEVGREYHCSFTRVEYLGILRKGNGSDNFTILISGPETITVPAGPFLVYKFEMEDRWTSSTDKTGISKTVYYLSKNVGWIRIEKGTAAYDRVTPPAIPLSVTPTRLNLVPNESKTCTISGGKAPYTAISNNEGVVMAVVSGGTLTCTGAGQGVTTVTVKDSANSTVSVSVTVAIDNLKVSCSQLELQPQETGSCTISGGMPPYSARSDNVNVVQVSVVGNTLFYMGVRTGGAAITVRDSSGLSSEVRVNVPGPPPAPNVNPASALGRAAHFSWNPVSDADGYLFSYAPAPYEGPETIVSRDLGTQTGFSITFEEGEAYFWAVRAYNRYGKGPYSSIGHVYIPPNPVQVTPSSLSLSPGQSGSCMVTGGVAPYTAVSSDEKLVQTSLGGSTGNTLYYMGVSPGTATITVHDSASHSAVVSVTVLPPDLVVTPTSLYLSMGQSAGCGISGGMSPYKASSGDPSVASASVNGSNLTVIGSSPGSTTVTVSDSGADAATVSVVVVPQDLKVTPTTLTIVKGDSSQCLISGGISPYSAESSSNAVTVSVSGEELTLNGKSPGSSTVTVRDSGNDSATVSVMVKNPLSVSPSSLSLTPGENGSCTISGGVAPYTASSGDTGVVQASVGGSTLYYMGVSKGQTTISVWDSADHSTTVSVLVSPADLTVTPSNVSLSENQTKSCAITGGVIPYTAVSANQGVAVAEVSGTNVFVRGVRAGRTTVTISDSAGDSAALEVSVLMQGTGWRYDRSDMIGSSHYPYSSSVTTSNILKEKWSSASASGTLLTGDVTGDGFLEIITVFDNQLRIYSCQGDLLKQVTLGSSKCYVTMIEDINGDGINEIGIGNRASSLRIYFYDGQGNLLKTISKTGGSDAGMTPVGIFPNGDILVHYWVGYQWRSGYRGFGRFDINSNTDKWYYSVGPCHHTTSMADFDQDGLMEITNQSYTCHNGCSGDGYNHNGTPTTDGDMWLIVVDELGNEKFSVKYPGPSNGVAAHYFSDLNHDGTMEILAFEGHDPTHYPGTSQIHLFDRNGKISHTFGGDSNIYWTWAISDVNGDGKDEVVVSDGATLHILDDTLRPLRQKTIDGRVQLTCDVNGDGRQEIVLLSSEGVLTLLNRDLVVLDTVDLGKSGKVVASDTDRDGVVELICLTDKIVVLEPR